MILHHPDENAPENTDPDEYDDAAEQKADTDRYESRYGEASER